MATLARLATPTSRAAISHPPSSLASIGTLPQDVIRLVDVLARIEQRRQMRLRAALHTPTVRNMYDMRGAG